MSLPTLSHLQGIVLDSLGARELTGRELRAALKLQKVRKSGPAFYQLMARLEDSNFIEGRYEEKIIEGQRIRERRYKMLSEGQKALSELHSFYSQRANQVGGASYA